mgnify:CR=1 FL=1
MNPKQENIAKKIPRNNDKNKNNRQGALPRCSSNTAHGPYDDEVRDILNDEIKIPQGYKEYNDMFNILEELIRSGRYRRFNQWLRDQSVSTIGSPTSLAGRFYRYCYPLIMQKNKNVIFDMDKYQIVEVKPVEIPTIDKVPVNPSDAEKKEISQLKDEVGKLQKIKETSDQIENMKEESDKVLDDLAKEQEEQIDKQKEELKGKLEEKKMSSKNDYKHILGVVDRIRSQDFVGNFTHDNLVDTLRRMRRSEYSDVQKQIEAKYAELRMQPRNLIKGIEKIIKDNNITSQLKEKDISNNEKADEFRNKKIKDKASYQLMLRLEDEYNAKKRKKAREERELKEKEEERKKEEAFIARLSPEDRELYEIFKNGGKKAEEKHSSSHDDKITVKTPKTPVPSTTETPKKLTKSQKKALRKKRKREEEKLAATPTIPTTTKPTVAPSPPKPSPASVTPTPSASAPKTKKPTVVSPPPKPKYTPEQMYDIISKYHRTMFRGGVGIHMFNSTLKMLISDLKYKDLVKKILDNFSDEKNEKIESIKNISKIMLDNKVAIDNKKFAEKWNSYIGTFKNGDKLPATEGEIQMKIKEFVRGSFDLRTAPNRAYAERVVNEIINKYGFNIRDIPDKSHMTFDPYTSYREIIKSKEKGAIDTNPDNAKDFFPFDIHKIYNIIENGLKKKLTDSLKNDIEAIIDQETRNMRYHTNISHGTNTIQNVIVEIENYINEKKIDKSKIFKFSEQNRYRLKQLLSKFLNQ